VILGLSINHPVPGHGRLHERIDHLRLAPPVDPSFTRRPICVDARVTSNHSGHLVLDVMWRGGELGHLPQYRLHGRAAEGRDGTRAGMIPIPGHDPRGT
jgi:hypothetical protein